MILVYLNGRETAVEDKTPLDRLLQEQSGPLKLSPDTPVAVELNQRVIRRQAWSQTTLCARDRIEIVRLVGGG
jgi:thiamine biosynthesis protein ThiS